MLITQIRGALAEAGNQHEKAASNTDYLNKLLHIDATGFIGQLNTLLAKSDLSEQECLDAVKKLLAQRWQNIAGTVLSYTDQNRHYLTRLCFDLAKILHQQDNALATYQYMMPTLTHIDDHVLYYRDHIDQYTLDEVILSDDQKSLIPVALLTCLSHHGNVDINKLVNPYDGAPLSVTEQARLRLHSSQSRELIETFAQIQECKQGNGSIGGHVQKLIMALREGGEHGGEDGKELEAGVNALNGIIKFMEYWRLLPKERQIELRALTSRTDKRTFGNLIDILDKSDRDSFDCVESISGLLEKILSEHGEILFKDTKEDWQYISILAEKLDVLIKQMKVKTSGQDSHQIVFVDLLRELDGFQNVQSLPDLQALFHLLPVSQLPDVKEELLFLLKTHIKGSDDLHQLLMALQPEKFEFLFTCFINHHDTALGNLEEVAFLLEQLNSRQRDAFFLQFKAMSAGFSDNNLRFVRLFSYLSEEHRLALMRILGDHAVEIFTADLISLKIGLRYLPLEFCHILCEQYHDNQSKFFINGSQFADIYGSLEPEKQTVFYKNVADILPESIKNGRQLGYVLALLDAKQMETLCRKLVDKRPGPIFSGFEFCQAIFPLDPQQRKTVFDVFRPGLPDILTNDADFSLALRHLSSEDQTSLRQDIRCKAHIDSGEELSDEQLITRFIAQKQPQHARTNFTFFDHTRQINDSYLRDLLFGKKDAHNDSMSIN
ncbi:hypothetical protein [Legionella spiritensis]|uniref:hypothetical protein n=1 Tax=Legionella spiritensis TaxID=452 RepID=UPI000F6B466C|nr:hypothetical protein [Legionella spiritensis]VEG91731.1 Uncharacterised protein [Legionella spiritensis]